MVTRCGWCAGDDTAENAYHDNEWGVPVHDDRTLFEFLLLEGAQAGLSWRTILHKRAGYARAFANFDPAAVAAFTDARLDALREDTGIVRNRAKIAAARTNARAFVQIQSEWSSFDAWLWAFVDNRPVINAWRDWREVPATTPLSETVSAALKKRGFKFVGPTICHAYLQAVGVVMDHTVDCHRYAALAG